MDRLGGEPSEAASQPAQIAGRTDQIVLQTYFRPAAVTGVAQPKGADQFALRAFDAVATVHLFLKRLGLHFPPAGLQETMMLPDHQGAMRLGGADALRTLGADAAERVVPFKAIIHFARLGLLESAAVGAALAGGAERESSRDVYVEGFRGERFSPIRRGRRWAAHFAAFIVGGFQALTATDC